MVGMGFAINANNAANHIGEFVSGVGDINGDGINVFLIGTILYYDQPYKVL
jgi:hypothetical protein